MTPAKIRMVPMRTLPPTFKAVLSIGITVMVNNVDVKPEGYSLSGAFDKRASTRLSHPLPMASPSFSPIILPAAASGRYCEGTLKTLIILSNI